MLSPDTDGICTMCSCFHLVQASLSVSQEGDGVSRLCCCGDSSQLGCGYKSGFGWQWHSAGDGVGSVFSPTGILRKRDLADKQREGVSDSKNGGNIK